MLVCRYVVILLTFNLVSAAYAADWRTSLPPKGVASASVDQDGATLVVVCDDFSARRAQDLWGALTGNPRPHPNSRGVIELYFKEPRANWHKNEEIEFTVVADKKERVIGKTRAVALSPTGLVVRSEEGASWELVEMSFAEKSFTIRAGDYMRAFSAVNLRKAVEPVLTACGDQWEEALPALDAQRADFLLVVTWMIRGQPPSSHQSNFKSQETCQAARLQVLASAEDMLRKRIEEIRRTKSDYVDELIANELLNRPFVSVVCISK